MDPFETIMGRGGSEAIRAAGRFFMKDDPIHRTLAVITASAMSLFQLSLS
jgi:hypothetical protein